MRVRTGLVVLLAFGASLGASMRPGEAQRLAPIKGGKLLALCQNARARTACDAYISGVSDGIAGVQHMMTDRQGQSFAGSTCIPDATSAETLRSTVVDYLSGHPDSRDKPAAVPTFDALHAAFPCKGNG